MKRTLPALLLLVAIAAYAKKPPPKPKPPPPAPAQDFLEEEEARIAREAAEDQLEDPPAAEEDMADARQADPVVRAVNPHSANDDLTEDEKAALGVGSLCCCAVFIIGLLVLIVWLVKRGSGTPKAIQGNFAPQASAASPAQGGMQLSIFALALEPQAREIVEQQLSQLGISSVPNSPPTRGQLVRETARALLMVQPSWRQFGYGEKPGMPDLATAESSYRSASEDFRGRALAVGATASSNNGLVVVTLLVCCRRPLLGVSRLDDPQQVRSVLEDRMRVSDDELLGTELLWAPAAPGGRVTEAEIGLRFPEMLPLRRTAN